MKYKSGWLTIGMILLGTVFLWLFSKNFIFYAKTPGQYFYYVGQLMGLVGFTLFSLALVLNTRWKFLEELFGGLDRVYLAHHSVGGLALVALLVHPMSLAILHLEISPKDAAIFLLPGVDMVINYGKFGLYSLLTLLMLTFYVRLPYHIWKLTHQFLGVAYILVGFHMLLIPSDVLVFLPLRIYMISLLGVGLVSYAYRMLFHRFFLPKLYFTVEKIHPVSYEVTEVVLRPKGKMFTFEPGQFVFIRFLGDKIGTEQHPFSISSGTGDQDLRLSIKNLGDFTENIANIAVGTHVVVEGPYGKFAAHEDNSPQVWVGGGIGITPFLSLARSLGKEHKEPIVLFYSVKTKDEFIFLDELQTIAGRTPFFTVIPWISSADGHLTGEVIKKKAKQIRQAKILLCGPWRMMMDLKAELVNLGAPRKHIRYEEFELV